MNDRLKHRTRFQGLDDMDADLFGPKKTAAKDSGSSVKSQKQTDSETMVSGWEFMPLFQ